MIHLNIGSNLNSIHGSKFDNISIAIQLLIEAKLKIEKMLEQMKSDELTIDERVSHMNDFQKLTKLSMYIDKKLGREC